ncbi:MAG: hypothetical protein WAN11_10730 [Syntrophobacteraceae bacterium]
MGWLSGLLCNAVGGMMSAMWSYHVLVVSLLIAIIYLIFRRTNKEQNP